MIGEASNDKTSPHQGDSSKKEVAEGHFLRRQGQAQMTREAANDETRPQQGDSLKKEGGRRPPLKMTVV